MNNTFLLIKASFMNAFDPIKYKLKDKNERVKLIVFCLLLIYSLVVGLLGFGFIYYRLGTALKPVGALRLVMAIALVMASLISVFMSIYKAPGYLFSFKDYDILVSMPIKTGSILASKLFYMYINNSLAVLYVMVPATLIYALLNNEGIAFYILAILLILFLPIIPMVFGSLLSLGLGWFSTRFKKSNIIMLIGSVTLILLIMWGYSFVSKLSNANIQNNVDVIDTMIKFYLPATLFTNALIDNNVLSILLFILINVGILFIFIMLFAKSFKKINSKMNESYQSKAFKLKQLQVSTIRQALLKKEINFFFSTYIYALNTGFGVVMMTLACILLPINKEKFFSQIPELSSNSQEVFQFIVIMLAFCISMTFITAPSISLEGKNLWILKSLPIHPLDIFRGKIRLHLVIVIPVMVVDVLILSLGMRFTLIQFLSVLSLGMTYTLFIALMGIVINLCFPKLEWKAPVVVVKQSASVLLATFAAFTFIAIPVIIYRLIKVDNSPLFIFAWCLCLIAFSGLIWLWIKKRGVALFNKLSG